MPRRLRLVDEKPQARRQLPHRRIREPDAGQCLRRDFDGQHAVTLALTKLTWLEDTHAYASLMSLPRSSYSSPTAPESAPAVRQLHLARLSCVEEGQSRQLTVQTAEGAWEIREEDLVLGWAEDAAGAVRQAMLLAAAREPCQVVVREPGAPDRVVATGWTPR